MSDPGFVASDSAMTADDTSIAVTIPAGASAGNLALLVVTSEPSSLATATGLTAWTALPGFPVASASRASAFVGIYSAVLGSDPAVDPGDLVTVGVSTSGRLAAAVHVVGDATVLDSDLLNPGFMSSTPPFDEWTPGLAAVSEAARVVSVYGIIGGTTGEQAAWTADGATTEREDISSNHPSARNVTIMIADEAHAGGGAAAAQRTAESTIRLHWVSATIALAGTVTKPVADAGPDQVVGAGTTGVQLAGTPSDGGGAGGPYTHEWRIISDGSGGASLSSTTVEDPTLDVGTQSGLVVLGYTVTDSGAVESDEDTVTITVIGAGANAVPISDDATSGWSKEPPAAATFYELAADGDDQTYVYYTDPVGTVVIEWGLSDLTAPVGGEPVSPYARVSMFQGTSGTATLILKEGASTVIATSAPFNWSADEVIQDISFELSAGEVASIGDWNNLRWRLEGTVS